MTNKKRRYSVGPETSPDGTHFRVWAPACREVSLVVCDSDGREFARHPLEPEVSGHFSGWVSGLGPGAAYGFRLDADAMLYPDPASRFQPNGPHGPSAIVDPGVYRFRHTDFAGPAERGQVLYELHVGTFTPEGTYAAAAREFAELARIGVTTIELMPLAEFPGAFGWGYDGVALWAPSHLYGTSDDLKALIDAAHEHGLSVILDVVYNHFGPSGCYLERFAPDFFTTRYENDWGKALNFDGTNSAPVREFFIDNARYWIEEFHFDGLRLDATQQIYDESKPHVLGEIATAARKSAAAQGRHIYVCAENERQEERVFLDAKHDGFACDAAWNDDFHHTACVALTGRREAYYRDYTGSPQNFISAVKRGFLFQGQHYYHQAQRRGEPVLHIAGHRFITYLENHDQVANSVSGKRLGALTSPSLLRAITSFWLLAPPTPLLFQGQEFGSTAPFLFFADHEEGLVPLVLRGRREFLSQFPSIDEGLGVRLALPHARSTFEACKLDFSERTRNAGTYRLYQDLLAMRREDPAFLQQRTDLLDGACIGERAFVLRYFCTEGDRLVVVNLGPDLELDPAGEPLLAPPLGATWHLIFASEDVKYGGPSYRPPYHLGRWTLSAASTHVFRAESQ
jgi:maltooligosyltrehalose trehalohydrolase